MAWKGTCWIVLGQNLYFMLNMVAKQKFKQQICMFDLNELHQAKTSPQAQSHANQSH